MSIGGPTQRASPLSEATKPATDSIDATDRVKLAQSKIRAIAQVLARQAAREDHARILQETIASTAPKPTADCADPPINETDGR
jgi:hypothetical protein